ncbi:MAG: hypothetical protein ACE5FN_03570 [Leptospirillia bacterium]
MGAGANKAMPGMRSCRRAVIAFVVAATIPTLLIGAFVYAMDPFQHYRPSTAYFYNMRYLSPGLAKHLDYDILVVGDSLTQNFRESVIQRTLGAPALNLSMQGSSLFEQATLIRHAATTGKLRTVLWGIHPWAASGGIERVSTKDFPRFLYDNNPFNDWEYIYNRNILELSFSKLLHPPPPAAPELDRFNVWYNDKEMRPGRDRVLKKYHRPKRVNRRLSPDYAPGGLIASFNHNILSTVQGHPEVEFVIFVPPYSMLDYATELFAEPLRMNAKMRFLAHAFEQLSDEPNVRLFFFSGVTSLTGNLDNYRDVRHYWMHINDWMLESIAGNRFRLTPDNWQAVFSSFLQMVRDADIDTLMAPVPKDASPLG